MNDFSKIACIATDGIDNTSNALPIHVALSELQSEIEGEVVLPSNEKFDDSRKVFNPAVDPKPYAVIYCKSEHDVRECLRFVEQLGLKFTVRSGGHSLVGYSSANDKLLIDVSQLNNVAVDAINLMATVETGTNFGKLNATLDTYNLHVPGGECDGVSIGGFVQGGGYGFTSRTFGMNCDNVIALRVMLADGMVVTASATEHADLWWAMLGGTGGNFGVLLSVTYRLHKLSQICGWALAWPLTQPQDRANAAIALKLLQSRYMKYGAPKELNSQVMICYQTDKPDLSGMQPWLLVRGTYLGKLDECETLIAPLAQTDGCHRQYVITDTYIKINAALLSQPVSVPQFDISDGQRPCQRKQARYVSRDLDVGDWRTLLDFYVTSPNLLSYMCIEVYGGEINAAPEGLNAFIHRDVAFSISLGVFWKKQSEQQVVIQFLKEWCSVMEPFWNGHVYQNYPSPDIPDYRWNYWGDAFERLLQVKEKYDPMNKFEFPQMIKSRELSSRPST